MITRIFYICCLSLGLSYHAFTATNSVIIGYIGTPPTEMMKEVSKKFGLDIAINPGGIPVSYAGYLDYSNKDGLIQFGKQHASEKLRVIITPSIHFEFVKGSTISHTTLNKELSISGVQNVKSYLFEKKKDNDGNSFWHVAKNIVPTKIRSFDLIIFAQPEEIVVNEGDYYIGEESSHMVLPKNCIVTAAPITRIDMMDISQYFKPIPVTQKENDRIQIAIESM